jgi:hypothetical protein
VDLVGPDGLLNQLTRNVLETALEAEMTEHRLRAGAVAAVPVRPVGSCLS